MNLTEKLNARSSLNQARTDVFEELDYLYLEKRKNEDLIKNLHGQIKILRQEAELKDAKHATVVRHLTNQERHVYKLFEHSLLEMYLALVAAFIAIGFAVWAW